MTRARVRFTWLRSGKTSWVGPYLFYDEGVPGVTFAEPAYDPSGKFVGVITVDFDLINLSRFARQSEVGMPGHSRMIILTPDGYVLGDPAVHLTETPGNGADGHMLTVKDVNDPLAAAMYEAVPPSVRNEISAATSRPTTEPGTLEHFHPIIFDYDGQPYFAGVTTFQVDDGLTWMVVMAVPQADFLAEGKGGDLSCGRVRGRSGGGDDRDDCFGPAGVGSDPGIGRVHEASWGGRSG